MNIRWLVIFAEVASDGSFIRTATRLNVAQPWLSAQVQRLEAQCGVRLFERLNTGLELTPEGHELLPFAELVASGSRQFRERARAMGDVRNKSVRIGSYLPMLEISALHQLNGRFSLRYPQYAMVAERQSIDTMLAALAEGHLDLIAAITPLPAREDLVLDQLELDRIEPFLLSPRSAEPNIAGSLKGITIAASSIATHPALMNSLLVPLASAGAEIRNAPEGGSMALEHLVRARAVSALMIHGRAADYAEDPDLVAIPLPAMGARHVLVRIAGRGLARAAEHYWTIAKQASAAAPSPDPQPEPAI